MWNELGTFIRTAVLNWKNNTSEWVEGLATKIAWVVANLEKSKALEEAQYVTDLRAGKGDQAVSEAEVQKGTQLHFGHAAKDQSYYDKVLAGKDPAALAVEDVQKAIHDDFQKRRDDPAFKSELANIQKEHDANAAAIETARVKGGENIAGGNKAGADAIREAQARVDAAQKGFLTAKDAVAAVAKDNKGKGNAAPPAGPMPLPQMVAKSSPFGTFSAVQAMRGVAQPRVETLLTKIEKNTRGKGAHPFVVVGA